MTQTNILRVDSLVELLVYAAVWLPWPFAARDVLIQAVGVDVLAEDGSLAISFASPCAPGELVRCARGIGWARSRQGG